MMEWETRRRLSVPALMLIVVGVLAVMAPATAEDIPAAEVVVYSSYPEVVPGSYPSMGFQATQTFEFGDHVAFAGSARGLSSVSVMLTDWACENDFTWDTDHWVANRGSSDACVTTPGSSFLHPITLNLYAVDNSGDDPALGALIATKTIDADIPFRPSWDDTNCTADGQTPATYQPFGGKWYDPVLGTCVTGYNFTVEFDFSADGVTLPDEVVFGIAYNTQTYGDNPIGAVGPFDSLNMAVGDVTAAVGTDVEVDTVFFETVTAGWYCDGGTGGSGTFRRDGGCWGGYVPVAEFVMETEFCNGLPAIWLGTDGPDDFTGTAADEVFVMKGGDDIVHAGDGNDVICGGSGADMLYGEGGRDLIFGEVGSDTLYGGDGRDRIFGQSGDDTLYGDAADDRLNGGLGNDLIYGGGGDDILRGQFDDDTLDGEIGDDTLFGGAGADSLTGGPGTDILRGGGGLDACFTGETVTGC